MILNREVLVTSACNESDFCNERTNNTNTQTFTCVRIEWQIERTNKMVSLNRVVISMRTYGEVIVKKEIHNYLIAAKISLVTAILQISLNVCAPAIRLGSDEGHARNSFSFPSLSLLKNSIGQKVVTYYIAVIICEII